MDSFPSVGLLAARVLVGPSRRLDPVSRAMAAAPLGWPPGLPGPAVRGFLACAAVVRRDAFLSAGGFNAKLGIYGEEDLLAIDLAAAGWGLAYVPELRVRHLPCGQGRDPRARRRQEARNSLLTAWLRRPVPVAARMALRAARDRDGRAGLFRAAMWLPWVLRNRRPVPPGLEAELASLAPGAGSRAAVRTGAIDGVGPVATRRVGSAARAGTAKRGTAGSPED